MRTRRLTSAVLASLILACTSDDAGALALASGGTVTVQLLGCDALRCAVANDAKLADGLRLRRADAAP